MGRTKIRVKVVDVARREDILSLHASDTMSCGWLGSFINIGACPRSDIPQSGYGYGEKRALKSGQKSVIILIWAN